MQTRRKNEQMKEAAEAKRKLAEEQRQQAEQKRQEKDRQARERELKEKEDERRLQEANNVSTSTRFCIIDKLLVCVSLALFATFLKVFTIYWYLQLEYS